MQNKIYIFYVKSDKNLTLLEPNPDLYPEFDNYFVGKIMPNDWTPPEIKIYRKNSPMLAFIGWMQRAPVIIEDIKKKLEPFISQYVQFFYLTTVKGKRLFAINVIKVVDCLDLNKSDIRYASSNKNRILHFKSYVFDENKANEAIKVPIFKVPQAPNEIFVTKDFIEQIISNKLYGAGFAYPSKAISYLFEDDVTNINNFLPND